LGVRGAASGPENGAVRKKKPRSIWNRGIVKAEDAKLPVVANIYKMIREISASVDLIEAEDARREAARQASEKFQKDISNEQQ
jgi:hypothetical protein